MFFNKIIKWFKFFNSIIKIFIIIFACLLSASCTSLQEKVTQLEAENKCLRVIQDSDGIDLTAFRTFRISAPHEKWLTFELFHSPSKSQMGSTSCAAAAPRYRLSNIAIDKNRLTADGQYMNMLLRTNETKDVSIIFVAEKFNRMERRAEDYIPTFKGTVIIKEKP
jgi:hypothetical protein